MRLPFIPSILSLFLGVFSGCDEASVGVRFAIIGDYGFAGQAEEDVANMVAGWNPDFIITTGDNNYSEGAMTSIDQNVGRYYHRFIAPYHGIYGQGSSVNRFFPSLGNHDWAAPDALPYRAYFTLPNNERYYDVVFGTVHLFALDSDPREPDGTSSESVQAQWLRNALARSTARWKIVYFHHPPYSSGREHGSTQYMQWPFKQWGATAVISGHEHNYERIILDGFPYMVNGLGGRGLYSIESTIEGSVAHYDDEFGAQLVTADDKYIAFEFYNRKHALIDRLIISAK